MHKTRVLLFSSSPVQLETFYYIIHYTLLHFIYTLFIHYYILLHSKIRNHTSQLIHNQTTHHPPASHYPPARLGVSISVGLSVTFLPLCSPAVPVSSLTSVLPHSVNCSPRDTWSLHPFCRSSICFCLFLPLPCSLSALQLHPFSPSSTPLLPPSLTLQVVMHPSCSLFLLRSHLILLLSQHHAALQPKCPALSSSQPTLCEVPLLCCPRPTADPRPLYVTLCQLQTGTCHLPTCQ